MRLDLNVKDAQALAWEDICLKYLLVPFGKDFKPWI